MPDGIRDHEVVSIYPYSDEQIDQLMNAAGECVLMWGTQDGWPVGVYHSFVWKNGKFWITCAAHRHRVAAIRRVSRSPSVASRRAARARRVGPRRRSAARSYAKTARRRIGSIATSPTSRIRTTRRPRTTSSSGSIRPCASSSRRPQRSGSPSMARSPAGIWGEPSRTKSAGRASTRTLSVCAPSANAAASIQTRASRSNQRACRRGGSRHEAGDAAVRKGSKAHRIGGRRQSTLRTSLGPNIAGGPSTQKPVELLRRPLVNHHGDVYDPSVGWGATIIGAERKAIAAKPWTSTRVRRSCGQALGDECGHPYERPIRSSNRR